jgi:hypothetical protein
MGMYRVHLQQRAELDRVCYVRWGAIGLDDAWDFKSIASQSVTTGRILVLVFLYAAVISLHRYFLFLFFFLLLLKFSYCRISC